MDDAGVLAGGSGSTEQLDAQAESCRLHLSEMPELLTITQAARCLGLGRSTLYRLIAEGKVPVKQFLIGHEMRLAKRQLEAWLEGRVQESPPDQLSTYGELQQIFSPRAS